MEVLGVIAGVRCRLCDERVPLVEAGEHEATCPKLILHPLELLAGPRRSADRVPSRGGAKPKRVLDAQS